MKKKPTSPEVHALQQITDELLWSMYQQYPTDSPEDVRKRKIHKELVGKLRRAVRKKLNDPNRGKIVEFKPPD